MPRKFFLGAMNVLIVVLVLLIASGARTFAQGPLPSGVAVNVGTGISYQGQLRLSGAPVNATCDFIFRVFDAASGGAQSGATVNATLPVTNGLFTRVLDFGDTTFTGEARWLDIQVRCPTGVGGYITMNPRQTLSPAPYALALPGLRTTQNLTSPNIIGGFISNTAASGAVGVVIAGGGNGVPGLANSVSGDFGSIGGGTGNRVSSAVGTIGGGGTNYVGAVNATVGGGLFNRAVGRAAIIGGGQVMSVTGDYATVAGGSNNNAFNDYTAIGGGLQNLASGQYAAIAGGTQITASGDYAAVGGGSINLATADHATVAGGYDNIAGNQYSAIVGGYHNRATGYNSFVGGGNNNFADGYESTIPGGDGNHADGQYSFAAGLAAHAMHDGTFVWADHNLATFTSTGDDQFLIRAGGGVGIGTAAPETQLHVKKSVNGTATNPSDNVAVIENTNTNNGADVLALKIGGTISPTISNNFITFLSGNNTSFGAIQGNGSSSVELAGGGNDYAEWLPRRLAAETLSPGDIVGIVDGHVTKETHGAAQFMVISTGPIVVGNDPGEAARDAYAKVAFIGQARVKVRGPVRAGDFIMPSGLNDGTGIAVAPDVIGAQQFAQVVGQAWESSQDAGVRSVNVAVGLIQHDPTVRRLVENNAAQAEQLASLESRMSAIETGGAQPPWLLLGAVFIVGVVLSRLKR